LAFEIHEEAYGVVSNSLTLNNGFLSTGCEFSPDGTKVYETYSWYNIGGYLLQWDLCTGTLSPLAAPQYSFHFPQNTNFPSGLQLATNGKIYVANVNSVIDDPNLAGAACHFTTAPFFNFSYNLPGFNSSFFRQASQPFTYTINPNTQCRVVTFSSGAPSTVCNAAVTVLSNQWTFGDPASGTANTASGSNPVHTYSSPGTYTAQLVINYECSADTLKKVVNVGSADPVLSITGNTLLCKGETTTLTISGANSYAWSANSSASVVALTPPVISTYIVVGTNTTNGCSASKIVTITVAPCTGIAGLNSAQPDLKIYPVPATDHLTISSANTQALKEIKTLMIYNYAGQLIREEEVNTKEEQLIISTADLSNGVYVLVLKYSNDKSSYSRFIVSRS